VAFYKILSQVSVLFLLIAVGYLTGKLRLLTDRGVKELTDLLIYIVSPVVIIFSFQLPFTKARASGLLISTLAAFGVHIFGIALATFVLNRRTVPDEERRRVLRFGAVYSNSGFMGLPLLDALAGTEGVFYGSVYMVVFNIFCWTHGYALFTGKGDKKSYLKALYNPNLIAVIIGMFFFFLSIRLPGPVDSGLQYLYNLNTPLSMLIIGNRLSQFKLRRLFLDRWIWPGIALRNLVIPAALVGALHLCGLRGTMLLCCSLSAACPVAANTVLFAELTGKSTEFPTKLMMVSTFLCIGTIPLIVALGTSLSGL
jgi:predicted permease